MNFTQNLESLGGFVFSAQDVFRAPGKFRNFLAPQQSQHQRASLWRCLGMSERFAKWFRSLRRITRELLADCDRASAQTPVCSFVLARSVWVAEVEIISLPESINLDSASARLSFPWSLYLSETEFGCRRNGRAQGWLVTFQRITGGEWVSCPHTRILGFASAFSLPFE